ncbi:MAG TPA: hypothetical protein VL422_05125 [Miltoncostaea sp.]|nr:hypothetical protein [Miltoncostaea sp.]
MIPHTRDRLLLAFADLAGDGLIAPPAIDAGPGEAPEGELRRDLRLHTSGPEAACATLEACRRAGVPALRDGTGELVVSAAVSAVAVA